jgi:hypothetical protein
MKSHRSPDQQKIADFCTLKACKTPKTLSDARQTEHEAVTDPRRDALAGCYGDVYGIPRDENTITTNILVLNGGKCGGNAPH